MPQRMYRLVIEARKRMMHIKMFPRYAIIWTSSPIMEAAFVFSIVSRRYLDKLYRASLLVWGPFVVSMCVPVFPPAAHCPPPPVRPPGPTLEPHRPMWAPSEPP